MRLINNIKVLMQQIQDGRFQTDLDPGNISDTVCPESSDPTEKKF